MDKKKLNTKDGSEFTVFFLKEQPKEVSGKLFELLPPVPLDSDFGYPTMSLKDIAVPYFNLPFSNKEKLMIDDRIESDSVSVPLKGYLYKYSGDMRSYRYISENIVGEDCFWNLMDAKGRTYLVPAEDYHLYSLNASEVNEFEMEEEL